MVDCFPNVFRASRGVDIIYQNYSLVEATMVCLEDLSTKPYKYVINLCAHDYPLKSNFQIVRSLKDCGSRMKKSKTVSLHKFHIRSKICARPFKFSSEIKKDYSRTVKGFKVVIVSNQYRFLTLVRISKVVLPTYGKISVQPLLRKGLVQDSQCL